MNYKKSNDVWKSVDYLATRCKSAPGNDQHKLQSMENFFGKHVKTEPDYSIKKLHELITDPITQVSKPWIDRLLRDVLRGIGNRGYKVGDLPAVMQILEFLAWEAREVPEFQKHLSKMLDLCAQTPRLEKSSEVFSCIDVLERYFSLLGHLVRILPDHQEILKVLEALCQLLIRTNSGDIPTVKLDLCHRAVEKSKLPIVVTELIETCDSEIYERVLDLARILVNASDMCCHRMLERGIINNLLIKLAYSLRISSDNISYSDKIHKNIDNRMTLTVSILWTSMRSIAPPKNISEKIKNFPPSSQAMISLRKLFKYSINASACSKSFMIIRNDLVSIILLGSVVLSLWPLVGSGLAEDLIAFAASKKTSSTKADIFFRKTLLYFLCHQANCSASISIMEDKEVISAILETLEGDSSILWNSPLRSSLSLFSLRTLAFLVPKMPNQFVNKGGPSKLLSLLEWSIITGMDDTTVRELARSICFMNISKQIDLSRDFREAGIIYLILKLSNRILVLDKLTLNYQRILTFFLIILKSVMKDEDCLIENYGDQSIKMVMKVLQRFISKRAEDFLMDQRLIIAVGSFIWECIVRSGETVQNFIENGGVYLILDVVEKSNSPVQNVYFGALADMCTASNCIPHLCTWRGVDKSKGLLSLMAKLWRDEEKELGVKRTPEGCLDDVELPLMGTEQWNSTFHSEITSKSSPTLAAIIGSIRPKIYSIRQFLISNSDVYEKVRERYKILSDDLPVEDSITFCIIDRYYRFIQGQVWAEVLRHLKQVGVIPLGSDGEILLVMNQRYGACGLHVQDRQEKILKEAERKEIQLEIDEFSQIRQSKLAPALEALKEMDFIRRATDRSYRLKKKNEQAMKINQVLTFPKNGEIGEFQRTYPENWKITRIFNQNYTIKSSYSNLKQDFEDMPLVSPESSEFDFSPVSK